MKENQFFFLVSMQLAGYTVFEDKEVDEGSISN